MSDTAPRPNDSPSGYVEPGKDNVQLIYILYLVGFVIGITVLIGVIMAYINRGQASGWAQSHYTYLIRTFWIGLLYGIASFLLAFIIIGFATAVLTAIWMIIRCVKGLQFAGRRDPVPNPETWLW
ncbi:MAG: hypothetical protein AAFX92_19770 [Pseudomonadota bacterium]